jgi:curved DNA-binding protein CbpA
MPDLYAVLGVGRAADAGEIRAAYRRRARRHHPDLGGDEQRMMVLNKAWHVLGNAERRAAYDARRSGRKSTPAKSRDGYTVLDFGRFEGWSLREIAGEDDNYLEWLRCTPAGRVLNREISQILDRREESFDELRTAPVATKRRRSWRRR